MVLRRFVGHEGIHGEVVRFVLTGLVVLVVDYLVYRGLLFVMPYSPAKALAFVCGTTTSYLLNKFFTFGVPHRSYREVVLFIALYATSLTINVAVNRLALYGTEERVVLAYLLATAASTITNFLGMKFVVFRKRTVSPEIPSGGAPLRKRSAPQETRR